MAQQLQHKFVTELEKAERILSSDYILLSQKDQNDTEYMSRKIPYQKLCATVLADIDDKISVATSAAISGLALSVETNISAISALSAGLAETTSAVIKIANCVQKNKTDISAISAVTSSLLPLKDMDLSGYSGITVQRVADQYKWNIGHTNDVLSVSGRFSKFSYDSNGHMTGESAVTSADVVNLGSFITEAGVGLSSSAHTVRLKQATASEIGGVRVNGNNVELLNGGILSARDTTYSAGNGISLSRNAFSLVQAGTDQLGGVKVGANLSIDSAGVLCAQYIGEATETSAGLIQLGFTESGRDYAVKTIKGGGAYVTVPWTDTSSTFDTNTLKLSNDYSVISAISYSNGNITGISASLALYSLIRELSVQTKDVGDLSDCIQIGNGRIDYEIGTGELTLGGGIPLRDIARGGTKIPAVISGEVVTSAYSYDGEGHEVATKGLYIKLANNTAENRADNVYVDVMQLKDTVVEKVTYDHKTKNIIIKFNDASRSNISVYVGDLVDVYTAGTGLSCTSNQFYIPKTETWTFTLDDMSTRTRTVALI